MFITVFKILNYPMSTISVVHFSLIVICQTMFYQFNVYVTFIIILGSTTANTMTTTNASTSTTNADVNSQASDNDENEEKAEAVNENQAENESEDKNEAENESESEDKNENVAENKVENEDNEKDEKENQNENEEKEDSNELIQVNGHSESTSILSRASSSRGADIEDEGQETPKRPMSAKKRSVRIIDGHTSIDIQSNGDTTTDSNVKEGNK